MKYLYVLYTMRKVSQLYIECFVFHPSFHLPSMLNAQS